MAIYDPRLDTTAPRPGQVYRHFKGGLYAVLCVVEHTETAEQLVIYQSLESGHRWARPLGMWLQMAEVCPGTIGQRFTLQPEADYLDKPVPMICKVKRGGNYKVVVEDDHE